jgi:hypothetical protein
MEKPNPTTQPHPRKYEKNNERKILKDTPQTK